jgi:hypothetical protein
MTARRRFGLSPPANCQPGARVPNRLQFESRIRPIHRGVQPCVLVDKRLRSVPQIGAECRHSTVQNLFAPLIEHWLWPEAFAEL